MSSTTHQCARRCGGACPSWSGRPAGSAGTGTRAAPGSRSARRRALEYTIHNYNVNGLEYGQIRRPTLDYNLNYFVI